MNIRPNTSAQGPHFDLPARRSSVRSSGSSPFFWGGDSSCLLSQRRAVAAVGPLPLGPRGAPMLGPPRGRRRAPRFSWLSPLIGGVVFMIIRCSGSGFGADFGEVGRSCRARLGSSIIPRGSGTDERSGFAALNRHASPRACRSQGRRVAGAECRHMHRAQRAPEGRSGPGAWTVSNGTGGPAPRHGATTPMQLGSPAGAGCAAAMAQATSVALLSLARGRLFASPSQGCTALTRILCGQGLSRLACCVRRQ